MWYRRQDKIVIVLAGLMLATLAGCSNQSGPVEPQAVQTGVEKPEWMKAAERQGIELITLPPNPSLNRRVSVTRTCYPDTASRLKIQYNYNTTNGRNVWMSTELLVPVGALSSTQSLTMAVDDEVLLTDVSLTFGPHGTRFNTPALLQVDAKGLDFSSWDRNTVVRLYYYNPSLAVWEIMQADQISWKQNGQLVCVNGRLPHFSQYAFGRRSTS